MGKIILKNKGVTLIELMIVLVIAAILVGGIYTLFMTQSRSYSVQDQVSGVQQDARAALNFLSRDIRMAGAMIGAGSGSGFADGSDDSQFVQVQCVTTQTYTYAIVPIVNNDTDGGNQILDGTDAVAVVYAVKELGFVSSADSGTKSITLDRSFQDAPSYVSSETYAGKVFQVDASTSDGSTDIILQAFPDTSFLTDEKVYEVKAIEYRVGRTTVPSDSFLVLRRNNDPLIGDNNLPIVEDLQIAYQVEGVVYWTFDGVLDAANGETNDAALPAGLTNADIRMVRINLTVRTAVQDAVVQDAASTAQFNQPALEDHTNPADLNGPDGFRRRVYTTVVKVRNL